MKKLLLLALIACVHPTGDFAEVIQEGATRFQPPESYRMEWHSMEMCSGLRGNFDLVAWYHTQHIMVRDSTFEGGYFAKHHAIVIPDYQINNKIVIDHEEMHALLRGGADHPAQYFNGSCGNLMKP